MNKNGSILQFKKANCKNCYKCVRNCPVMAVRVRENQAQIVERQCVLCERCTVVCPQDAKVERNQVPEIMEAISRGEHIVASVHPSWLARYHKLDFEGVREALLQLGFSDAFEGTRGAGLMREAYEELLEKEGGKQAWLSSNCPVIVQLVEKHYPHLAGHLVPVQSSMSSHARFIKQQDPEAKVVCISPCISMMADLREPGSSSDYLITFQELDAWMAAKEVAFSFLEGRQSLVCRSRAAALPNGLTLTMKPVEGVRYLSVDGMEGCKNVLEELQEGGYEDCFIELHACTNGCVGGPAFLKEKRKLLEDLTAVQKGAFTTDASRQKVPVEVKGLDLHRHFDVPDPLAEPMPSEAEIGKILAKMGKYSREDELNCGACGYDTCREKAIAISRNKAEVAMCVPYMRAKQEDYSNKVFNAMPGMLVTVDYNLKIVQMNQAAMDFFNIQRKRELIGKPVSDIMDDYSLASILSFDRNMMHDEVYQEEQKRYLDRDMTNDRKNQMILCIMKDITRERIERDKILSAQREAARMADRLVEEQLKIVHQIASLLGETASDTKVAVEELKKTILLGNEGKNEKK